MVEDNVNNRDISTMELAKALKMQLESIKHQGARQAIEGQDFSGDIDKHSNEVVAERNGMSVKQVQRYISLTKLIPPLQDMVDGKTNWEDERFAEAGELFQDIGNSGIYNDGFLGLDYNGRRELFLSGNAAMYPMGTWDTSAIRDSFGGAISTVGEFI